jgi:hypothetical protein
MKAWASYAEAAKELRRSKRTLRRWVAEDLDAIRTMRADDGTILVNMGDAYRLEAIKSAYRDAPTFGRRQPSMFGSVAEQRSRRHA